MITRLKILILFAISCNLLACGQTSREKEIMTQLINSADSLTQYPAEKQASYILHFNTKTPYELYVDDIFITDESSSGISQTIELNPYLLENGTHKIRLRYLPQKNAKDGLLHPQDVYASDDYRWRVHFIKLKLDPTREFLGYEGQIDYPASDLPIITPPTAVPFWDQEWEVEVKDLPYHMRGWRDGEDLSKLDQDELEKEVVAYYNKLRTMLNDGRIGEYYKLRSRRNTEVNTALYSTPEEFAVLLKEDMEEMQELCTGNMLPIQNYTMQLGAEGKLVALFVPFGDPGRSIYWKALISDTEERSSSWGVWLYRPRGSKDFVPIR